MASQQQPRRWFSLGSFNRPVQPPPPRPSAPTPPSQQPGTRPQVLQLKAHSPPPTPPQETAPTKPPGPAGGPNAASAPSFPVAATTPSAPPAPNVTSAPLSAARPAPPLALQPRSAAAPAPATAPAQRSPTTASVTPAPLFPARAFPPTAPAPRPPAAMISPATPTSKSPAPSPPRAITKSSLTSPTTKTWISLHTSPNKAASQAPSTSLSIASSPSRSPPPSAPSPPTAVPTATIMNRAHTKVSSPKTINTPPKPTHESAQVKPISHPPSPLTLPPAQIKAQIDREPKIPTDVEQKTVLVHETPAKPKTTPTNSGDFKQKYLEKTKMYTGQNETGKVVHKKLFDSEKFGTRIITLAGENRGAIMELSTSRNKGKSNGWRNGKELETDFATAVKEAERSKINDKTHKIMEVQSPPMTVYINSNVQGVNNSILCNGTVTHNDPGVHKSFSTKANGGHGIHLKDHTRG